MTAPLRHASVDSDRRILGLPARFFKGRLAGSPRRMLIGLVILLFALLTLRLTGFAERAFYYPDRTAFATPAGIEDVTFTNADGLTLHGWFLRAVGAKAGEPRPIIIHAHGNAGNLESHAGFSDFLTASGAHVLMFDYRGYGRSDPAGSLRRGALLTDTLAAVDYAKSRPDVLAGRIGMYGVSLGGSFALAAAAERPEIKCVVSIAAFSSWAGIANDHSRGMGWLLMPRGLDASSSIAKLIGRPILIVHGTADTIVPVRHAELLLTAAGENPECELVLVQDGEHNTVVETEPVREKILKFFRKEL